MVDLNIDFSIKAFKTYKYYEFNWYLILINVYLKGCRVGKLKMRTSNKEIKFTRDVEKEVERERKKKSS